MRHHSDPLFVEGLNNPACSLHDEEMTPDSRSLFRNAYALMAATVLTSLLGMAYWALAARLYDAETVGRAAAAISAMLLLCNASQLNLSVGLMRFLPVSAGREARLVTTSYVVAFLVGFLLSMGFLLVAGGISSELRFLTNSLLFAILFVVGVCTWTTFSLQDAVLTGLRATVWVPVENGIFGILKLILLIGFAGAFLDAGILLSWVLPMAVMLVPVNLLIFRRFIPRHREVAAAPHGPPPGAGVIVRFVGGDYVGTLLSHGSTTALPLLVITLAGPQESAVFYVAWTLGVALDFIATGTASSVLVESSSRPGSTTLHRRMAARRAMLLLGPVVAAVVLLADPLLWVFGEEYRAARWALVLLALAAVPRLFLLLRLAHLRVLRRVGAIVRLQALACVTMLGLSATTLSMGWGSNGVALSWLVTQLVTLTAALSTRLEDEPAAVPETADATSGRSTVQT